MNEHGWLSANNPNDLLSFLARLTRSEYSQREYLAIVCAGLRLVELTGKESTLVSKVENWICFEPFQAGKLNMDFGKNQSLKNCFAGAKKGLAFRSDAIPFNNLQIFSEDRGLILELRKEITFHRNIHFCNVIRSIIQNPFRMCLHPRCGVPFLRQQTEADWLSEKYLTDQVKAIARDIYRSRTYQELPVLADALEDAGCTNETILNHLRFQNRCFLCAGRIVWNCKDSRTQSSCADKQKERQKECTLCRGTGWVSVPDPLRRVNRILGDWSVDLLLGNRQRPHSVEPYEVIDGV